MNALKSAAILVLTLCLCSSPVGAQSQPPIEFVFATPRSKLPKPAVLAWLNQARQAVSSYYGKFPVEGLQVIISDEAGDSVGFATTGFEDGHPLIEVPIGTAIDIDTFKTSWTATHEMVHLAFPLVAKQDKWVAEGMATYIEPLARLQVGQVTRQAVWNDMLKYLPEGLSRAGDKGFRGNTDWGQTYWGGALYCLLADIEIRKQTENKLGFRDAMRGIVKAGATIHSDYSAEQALGFGDKTLGLKILQPLYKRMSEQPVIVDPVALLRQLGIRKQGNSVTFDESAPLAAVRRGIEGRQ